MAPEDDDQPMFPDNLANDLPCQEEAEVLHLRRIGK
jgi:hypothetical protein